MLSARTLRNAVFVERITQTHQANYGVYGVQKMCHALRREDIAIGREQTAELMRLAEVREKCPTITRRANGVDRRPDQVKPQFSAEQPHQLWVADITYVLTTKGFVYAAFVTDVFSRRIVGWTPNE